MGMFNVMLDMKLTGGYETSEMCKYRHCGEHGAGVVMCI